MPKPKERSARRVHRIEITDHGTGEKSVQEIEKGRGTIFGKWGKTFTFFRSTGTPLAKKGFGKAGLHINEHHLSIRTDEKGLKISPQAGIVKHEDGKSLDLKALSPGEKIKLILKGSGSVSDHSTPITVRLLDEVEKREPTDWIEVNKEDSDEREDVIHLEPRRRKTR